MIFSNKSLEFKCKTMGTSSPTFQMDTSVETEALQFSLQSASLFMPKAFNLFSKLRLLRWKKKKKDCIRKSNSIPSSELRWQPFCTDFIVCHCFKEERELCYSWRIPRIPSGHRAECFMHLPHVVFTEPFQVNLSILQMGKQSPRIANLSKLKEARIKSS